MSLITPIGAIAKFHNGLLNTVINTLPLGRLEDSTRGLWINNYSNETYWNSVKLNDSHSSAIIKLLAPIALAAVATYLCPVLSLNLTIRYVIKGVIFLGSYAVSGPLLGSLWYLAKKIGQLVISILAVNPNDGLVKSTIKQIVLPLLAGLAINYFFPVHLLASLTLRQTAILIGTPISYIVFDKLINPRIVTLSNTPSWGATDDYPKMNQETQAPNGVAGFPVDESDDSFHMQDRIATLNPTLQANEYAVQAGAITPIGVGAGPATLVETPTISDQDPPANNNSFHPPLTIQPQIINTDSVGRITSPGMMSPL